MQPSTHRALETLVIHAGSKTGKHGLTTRLDIFAERVDSIVKTYVIYTDHYNEYGYGHDRAESIADLLDALADIYVTLQPKSDAQLSSEMLKLRQRLVALFAQPHFS